MRKPQVLQAGHYRPLLLVWRSKLVWLWWAMDVSLQNWCREATPLTTSINSWKSRQAFNLKAPSVVSLYDLNTLVCSMPYNIKPDKDT